jgi:hypothetical protein
MECEQMISQSGPSYTERENYTVLSPAETARLLGVHKLTLLRMRQRDDYGGLPYVRLSSNRIGYVWHDVQAFLAARRVGVLPEQRPEAA